MENSYLDNTMGSYIALYNTGTSITSDEVYDFLSDSLYGKDKDTRLTSSNIRSIIETYNILTLGNTCIKLIDRDKAYKEIAKLEALYNYYSNSVLKIKHFVNDNRYFYMVPLQTVTGTIVGFIFRRVFDTAGSRKNRYISIYLEPKDRIKKVPIMYGWYSDFLDYDSHDKCKPIVLCEGLKDCIYLKQFYPYVLANNTSNARANVNILRNLTNKVILMYDNDETGDISSQDDSRYFSDLGFKVHILKLIDMVRCLENKSGNIKDAAELINYPNLEEQFKYNFLRIVNKLDKE